MNWSQKAKLEETEVRELLQRAGPRVEVPAADAARIRAAARDAWEAAVDASAPRRRARFLLPLAAALAAAVVAGWWWLGRPGPPVQAEVATLALARGEVRAGAPGGASAPGLAVGTALTAGSELETGPGEARLALLWSGGQSLRLDSATRVRLVSERRLELLRGAVYFDSAGGSPDAAVEIGTPLGTVTEIGTRYATRLVDGPAGLTVRVRQGSVVLDTAGGRHLAVEGEELRLGRDGTLLRSQIELYGPEWEWVVAATPAFEIEGRALGAYLDWLVEETGWRVQFEDEALEAASRGTELRGTIDGLTLLESLDVVMDASDLSYRIDGDEVRLSRPARTRS